jgi:hypothetical protein
MLRRDGQATGVLGGLAETRDLVVYAYAGCGRSPAGEDVPRMDAIMHRAFRASAGVLLGLGFGVVGISSQPRKAQRRAVVCGRLEHEMLSDPWLLLARELALPTFATRGWWDAG